MLRDSSVGFALFYCVYLSHISAFMNFDDDIFVDNSLPFAQTRKSESRNKPDDIYLPSKDFSSFTGKWHSDHRNAGIARKPSEVKPVVSYKDKEEFGHGYIAPNTTVTKTDELQLCNYLQCRHREVCLVDSRTAQAECVPRKLLKRKYKHLRRPGALLPQPAVSSSSIFSFTGKSVPTSDSNAKDIVLERDRELSRKTQYLDEKAKLYEGKIRHGMKQNSVHKSNDIHPGLTVKNKKSAWLDNGDTALSSTVKVCTAQEMDEMGHRLLDWFKQLHDVMKERHVGKRSSRKKELKDENECACQTPVSWEFNHLDLDTNGVLAGDELRDLDSNGYEHCVMPFIESCDHDKDKQLSEREWCCCFVNYLPPCEQARSNMVVAVSGQVRVVVGSYVPQCDEDGFFTSVQCHSGVGQCWCVDRSGTEIVGSRMTGVPSCDTA